MILLYAASRDPRRGESPVMCARTVQVAALPGEVVSNTGKQNRKVLAAPVMGHLLPLPERPHSCGRSMGTVCHFYIRFFFSLPDGTAILSYLFLPRTVPMLVPQRLSNVERRTIMDPNINYYGIVILLRKLRECGSFTEKELRKIAARIAADNGVEVMFFL